jgi:DNA-binding PadR family transcriptional regulator
MSRKPGRKRRGDRRSPRLARPCTGVTLDKLVQPAILTVLAGGPLHGYRIGERIAESRMFHGERPDTTGIYRVLKTMQTRGLVASSWELSKSGPAKRRYRVTAAGRSCLGCWIRTLRDYHKAVGELLSMAKKSLR